MHNRDFFMGLPFFMATGADIKRLFLDHGRELRLYLTRKLRDAETAADLTQETFARFAEQSQGTVAVTHERSYLYRTAHNLAVDHVRGLRRDGIDRLDDDAFAQIPDDTPSPEQATAGHQELARLHAALAELPERTRLVFALVRVDGLTYAQTAKHLGISDSSVQKHLARAIKHVTQRLRPMRGQGE